MPSLATIVERIWGAIRDRTPFGGKIVKVAPMALLFVATHLGHVAAREIHEGHTVHEALIAVPAVLAFVVVMYWLYRLGPVEPVEKEPSLAEAFAALPAATADAVDQVIVRRLGHLIEDLQPEEPER